MKNSFLKISLASVVIACLMWSCGSNTYMVDSWKAPNAELQEDELKKVMVAVLATNETSRRNAEQHLAQRNPIFVPSYQVLANQGTATDTSASKSALESQGFDAVLTFRLREKNNTQTWVPGTTSGYGYWGYHGAYYGSYYDPGYMREDVNYMVETSLYSLTKNELLWSGITTSMNPTSIEQTINEIVVEVYKRMKEDGLFHEQTQNTK